MGLTLSLIVIGIAVRLLHNRTEQNRMASSSACNTPCDSDHNSNSNSSNILGDTDDTSEMETCLDNHNALLPPLSDRDLKAKRKTVVLDLDKTLIYAKREPDGPYDFMVDCTAPNIGGEGELVISTFYVTKRPLVDEFLLLLLKRGFEVVAFTTSKKVYASQVVKHIDPHGTIMHCLFRDSCILISGNYVKDLSRLGRSLKRVVIVDDSPEAYAFHRQNALPVSPFLGNPLDGELARIMRFFTSFESDYEDMREAIRHFLGPPDPPKLKRHVKTRLTIDPAKRLGLSGLIYYENTSDHRSSEKTSSFASPSKISE